MAENNYPKGSYLNPYTEEEHQTMKRSGSWSGGWLKEEDESLVYYSSSDVTSTEHGLKSAPYSIPVYTALKTWRQWIGGWVGRGLIELVDAVYCTANDNQYYDNDDGILGSRSHPVPVDVYAEMCKLGLWEGGWVSYDIDHDPYYVGHSISGNPEGYGYGCGSEEGSASYDGSEVDEGITPGEAVVGSNEDGTIKLKWTSQPLFNFEVYLCDGSSEYAIDRTSLFAMWDYCHTVSLTGTVHYIKRFSYTLTVVENGIPQERIIRHSIMKEMRVTSTTVTI